MKENGGGGKTKETLIKESLSLDWTKIYLGSAIKSLLLYENDFYIVRW